MRSLLLALAALTPAPPPAPDQLVDARAQTPIRALGDLVAWSAWDPARRSYGVQLLQGAEVVGLPLPRQDDRRGPLDLDLAPDTGGRPELVVAEGGRLVIHDVTTRRVRALPPPPSGSADSRPTAWHGRLAWVRTRPGAAPRVLLADDPGDPPVAPAAGAVEVPGLVRAGERVDELELAGRRLAAITTRPASEPGAAPRTQLRVARLPAAGAAAAASGGDGADADADARPGSGAAMLGGAGGGAGSGVGAGSGGGAGSGDSGAGSGGGAGAGGKAGSGGGGAGSGASGAKSGGGGGIGRVQAVERVGGADDRRLLTGASLVRGTLRYAVSCPAGERCAGPTGTWSFDLATSTYARADLSGEAAGWAALPDGGAVVAGAPPAGSGPQALGCADPARSEAAFSCPVRRSPPADYVLTPARRAR